MKFSQALPIMAQLATIVTAWEPTVAWATTWNLTHLEGDAALAYLFDYDPSIPHFMDYPGLNRSRTSNETGFPPSSRYDTHYISRLCSPLSASGENLIGIDVNGIMACEGLSHSQCEAKMRTYEVNLGMARTLFSGSEYPCERRVWVEQECGINIGDIEGRLDGSVVHKGTVAEQNRCLCEGDWFALLGACEDCYSLHHGNETLKERNEKYLSIMSSSMCGEAQTATKSMWDYQSSAWESVYTGYEWEEQFNTTIVSDGAQNKTDVGLYVTEMVDWVPATVREPSFTRTAQGKETLMTPGVLRGNAKKMEATPASGGEGAATVTQTGGAAAVTSAKEGSARSLSVPGGLVIAAVAALLVL